VAVHSQKITPVAVDAAAGHSLKVLACIPRTASHQPMATSLPLPVGDAADQVLVVEEASTPLSLTSRNIYFVDTKHDPPGSVAGSACQSENCQSEKGPTNSSSFDESPVFRQRHQQKTPEGEKQFAVTSRVSTSQNNWAGKLSQLHAQLVPYSGLIVALALVTSASLLYWLTLGPANALSEYPETPGISHWPIAASSEVTAAEQTADHGPATASTPQPDWPSFSASVDESPLVVEEPEADASQLADAGAQETTKQELEKITLPSHDTNDDLSEPLFPNTDFASPDFSLIGISPLESSEQEARDTQPTSPAVADRSLNAPTSSVRR